MIIDHFLLGAQTLQQAFVYSERGGTFLMKELMFTQQVYGNITYLLTDIQKLQAKLSKGTNTFSAHHISSRK